MQTVRLRGMGALGRALRAEIKNVEVRVLRATRLTATAGVGVAKANAPEAFGDIREGIISQPLASGARVRSSAPHSAAVENGSRPHRPPLEPILEWVRLRGTQGLGSKAGSAARFVARAIREQSADGGRSTPVDAARTIAWAIVEKIAREGTAPTLFMANSLPEISRLLDGHIKAVLAEPPSGRSGRG